MKPIIAHCRANFLPITETFIASQIKNLDSFDSIVLTREISERFKNSGDFEIYAKKSKRSLGWMLKKMSSEELNFFTNVIFEKKTALLHVHFGSDARYFLPLKKKTGVPFIVSFYGYDAYRLPKSFFGAGKAILRNVFKNADVVIAPSEHMKRQLAGLGCSERKIEVLPWGVSSLKNVETRHCRVSTGHGSKIKFIHIGRMVEKKGQIYLLEAFKKILERKIEAELVIIGNGPLKKKLLRTIDKLGIYDKVSLIDKMPNEEAVCELMSHNIYVQPSIMSHNGDSEGIPTAIMEAFSRGLPVIASLHSGIPEIVENGANGILVPERDSDKLADAMEKLAKNPDLRAQMGESGRRTVEERFDARKQVKKLENLYSKIICTYRC